MWTLGPLVYFKTKLERLPYLPADLPKPEAAK